MTSHDVTVVGGGPAGAAVAVALRARGRTVAVLVDPRLPLMATRLIRETVAGNASPLSGANALQHTRLTLAPLLRCPRLAGFEVSTEARQGFVR